MSGFTLTKWYLDCVDDAGALSIVYWARLAWKNVALSMVSVCTADADGVSTTTNVGGVPPPQLADGVLNFNAGMSGTSVGMVSRTRSFEQRLLDSPDGCIDWSCGIPCGETRVRRDGRDVLLGLGYAEVLRMSIAPWRLPIDELRWGRFTSTAASIVWIDWRGAHPMTLVLRDGTIVHGAVVTDSHVTAGDLTIDLNRERIIRDDHLGATLHEVPGLGHLIPDRLLTTSEQKWCNASTLRKGADVIGAGWTIHELVRFK